MTASAALADDYGIYEEAPLAFAGQELSGMPYRGADISRYVMYTAAPPWINDAKQKLDELGSLKAGWDSYAARPISKSARSAALQLLQEISLPSTPRPAIVPTSDGSVQLEWHTKGIDLEVRILSPSRVSVMLEDDHGEVNPLDDELQYDFRRLEAAMIVLSNR
jgi:hypothetical protein